MFKDRAQREPNIAFPVCARHRGAMFVSLNDSPPAVCDSRRSVIFKSRVELPLCSELNLALTPALLITAYPAHHAGLQWTVSSYHRCCYISLVTAAEQGECVHQIVHCG